MQWIEAQVIISCSSRTNLHNPPLQDQKLVAALDQAPYALPSSFKWLTCSAFNSTSLLLSNHHHHQPIYNMPQSFLLALNCGSSSLKTTLFSYPSLEQLSSISASSIGSDEANLKIKYKGKSNSTKVNAKESHSEIFSHILDEYKKLPGPLVQDSNQVKIVTHRIVHGGTLTEPVQVSKGHLEQLEKMEQVSISNLACSSLVLRTSNL
jgi:hypothetical protein